MNKIKYSAKVLLECSRQEKNKNAEINKPITDHQK